MSEPKPTWSSMEANFTLRDLFAAAALTGLLATQGTAMNHEYAADEAYGYADAMLVERERKR